MQVSFGESSVSYMKHASMIRSIYPFLVSTIIVIFSLSLSLLSEVDKIDVVIQNLSHLLATMGEGQVIKGNNSLLTKAEQCSSESQSFATPFSCVCSPVPCFCKNTSLFLPRTQVTVSRPANISFRHSFTQKYTPFIQDATFSSVENMEWYSASGICLSQADGILVPHSNSSYISQQAYLSSIPVRAMPYPDYTSLNETIRFVSGRSIMANCFRMGLRSTQPAHYLFGMGKVFSHLVSLNMGEQPVLPIDNVILHQCQNPFIFDFGAVTMRMFWRYGVEIGAFNEKTTLVVIPTNDKRKEAATYCLEDVRYNVWFGGQSLGRNSEEVVKIFREKLIAHAQREIPNGINLSSPKSDRTLRIKIFQRTSQTSNRMRRFTNLHEVVDLASKYTYPGTSVDVLLVDDSTPFWEQVRIFNSFDILITPHGSQLTNGIFTLHRTAIIEVIGACKEHNFHFRDNLSPFGTHYIVSLGHQPVGTNDQDKVFLQHCLTARNGRCNKQTKLNETKECNYRMKHSDIWVDIDVLQQHLEESLAALGNKNISR